MKSTVSIKKVPTWTVDEVRAYLEKHEPRDYTLLDVRQPEEYSEGHLPGARLVPVGELHERIGELDPERPTIVYCRAGVRGANGAGVLMNAGFGKVWNMDGGILAWNGLVATGAPEAGVSWFEEAATAEDCISLAWVLESGAKAFYERMAERFSGSEAGGLLARLGEDEGRHRETLRGLYREITGRDEEPVPPTGAGDMMEGGVSLGEALAWGERSEALDVLEFALAMEVNAYDTYLRVIEIVPDPKGKEAIDRLAREEKVHLDHLARSLVGMMGKGEADGRS